MWSEFLTALWVSSFVGLVVWVYTAQREWDKGFDACAEVYKEVWKELEVKYAQRRDVGGMGDPRGRVPLLGWVAVVPGAATAQAAAEAGDAEAESVEGGGEARQVTDEQLTELEEWFKTKEQRDGND